MYKTLLALGVLAVGFGPWLMFRNAMARSQRRDNQDILQHGVATMAIIRDVQLRQGRGGRLWSVTVEFQAPGRVEPVRATMKSEQVFWLGVPEQLNHMLEGEAVAIHYREKWPTLIVIDALVGQASSS